MADSRIVPLEDIDWRLGAVELVVGCQSMGKIVQDLLELREGTKVTIRRVRSKLAISTSYTYNRTLHCPFLRFRYWNNVVKLSKLSVYVCLSSLVINCTSVS